MLNVTESRHQEGAPQEKRPIILLSGIPAAGKSTYGRWMQAHKGYLHLDVEQPGVLQGAGVQNEWNAMFGPDGQSTGFLRALQGLTRPVIIDWGFPPRWLTVVIDFLSRGVRGWWLDGDISAARTAFTSRGSVPLERFDIQVAAINDRRTEIAEVFQGRVIRTISPGPTYLSEAEFCSRISAPERQ